MQIPGGISIHNTDYAPGSSSVAHWLLLSCPLPAFRLCLPSSLCHAPLRHEATAFWSDVITDAVLMSGCLGEQNGRALRMLTVYAHTYV